DFQQEVALENVFSDVASYCCTVTSPAQARHAIDRAMRIAMAERTVTCVIIANDVQLMDAVASPPRSHGSNYSSAKPSPSHPTPADAELQAAADVLNAGKKVALLVGAGGLGATDEIIQVCDTLGAGAAKALLGKAALPDDLPFVTGSIGLLGTKAS